MSLENPQAMHDIFGAAIARQDVDTLVGLYENGAVQVQQDGTTLIGSDDIRAALTRLVETPMKLSGTQTLAVVNDDIALTSTHYQAAQPDADGHVFTMTTAEVTRRQEDGSWRIVIDAPYLNLG